MGILPLEMEYMNHKEERRSKIFVYSLLEDFVDYCGFVYNGLIWSLGRHLYYAKPNWIETEQKFCGREIEVLRRARETSSQAIKTTVVLDDEVKLAIVDAHSKSFLKNNPRVLRDEERLWLDRKI